MKHARDFWSGVAPKYAARPISNMQAYETTLERISAHLPKGARVLELGCGTGGTAVRLAPHVAEVLATDIAPGMIAEAHKRDAPGNVRFAVGDVFDPVLARGGFDVVLALNLVHLLEDGAGFHARVRELLAPGGVYISKTPCVGEPELGWKFGLLKAVVPAMQWLGKAPFLRYLTRAEVEREISEAGFEVVETGDYPKVPPSHLVVARRG